MSHSFEYIDIILLAMIAGFIFLRLRGILGKRSGFEGKSAPQFQEILKNTKEEYLNNIELAEESIQQFNDATFQQKSKLFRPPYGKLSLKQASTLRKKGYKIIMWDILSYDFDQTITPEKCLDNVLKNVVNGSIIVFHDNVKAEQNLKYALPKTLAFLKEKGFVCAKID